MGEVWALKYDAIGLNFLKKLDSTDRSMWVFAREIRFLKWHDAINSNSWLELRVKS